MTLAAYLEANAACIRALAAQHRTANPRVFGSVARGQDGDGSDIDILVDPLPGATLFNLGALQMDLQDLLGRPVDLLTPGDVSTAFRATVLQAARAI